MPDDKKTEEISVTEQETIQDDVLIDTGNADALAAFNELDKDDKKTSEDVGEKEKKIKEEVKESEKAEETKEETDELKEPDEEDVDEKRGQEILDHEVEIKREKSEAEAEQTRLDAEEAEKRGTGIAPYSVDDIRVFRNVVPDSIFPDAIEVDGEEVDLKTYLDDNPEIKTISSIVAKNIIDTLLKNKYLASPDDLSALRHEITNQRFMDRVTDRTHGVQNAVEIYNSKEFKEWLPKQTDKIQALLRSNEEKDHIRIFKRYLKDSGLAKADEKIANLDKKRADKKKAVDAVYTTTVRSKKLAIPKVVSGQSARDEALAGFNESDEE
uniref:Uncharacterized protein n=1 Tax=viral metagenome TaxID=1070528 RepID=A0A6H1ZLD0_9ZZZZ